MSETTAKRDRRELAAIRKWFKQLLLKEWKNYEKEKYTSLTEKRELQLALRAEADVMLEEYKSKKITNRTENQKALEKIQARHVPNVFRDEKIELLQEMLIRTVSVEKRRSTSKGQWLPASEAEELERFGMSLFPKILDYASDEYPKLIREAELTTIDEIEDFAMFYLEMRMLLFKDSPLLSTDAKIKVKKIGHRNLDFHQSVNFFLDQSKQIRDDILDREHWELYDFNLYLNQYINHVPRQEPYQGAAPKNPKLTGESRPLAEFHALKDLSWSEIIITFTALDSLRIQARGARKRLTFAVIGFDDKRKGDLPDTRWEILRDDFAQNNGEVTHVTQFTAVKLKAGVWEINKRLRELFDISENAIFFDRRKRAYVTKFLIRDEIESPDRSKNYLR